MSTAERRAPIADAEADALFSGLEQAPALVLAVSGGPDSTALLLLAADWRRRLSAGPALLAVTIDHGLRPEAREEALAVKRLAKRIGVAHRTLRWSGAKPQTGLQKAARDARYRLLGEQAIRFGADHVLTAHTCDDQAETLLMRMSRGSGIGGLGGMARTARLPKGQGNGKGNALTLVRPFIGIPKARLVATVTDAGLPFVDDPSNRDPRFTRSRLRALMPALAGEGLDSSRLAQLASRLRRAEAALAATADAAWAACVTTSGAQRLAFGAAFAQLPAEIRVRLLGRAIGIIGDEGPVELGKLEALQEAIAANIVGRGRLRRTLAGALVTLGEGLLTVERAPPRRDRTLQRPRETLQSGPTSLPGSCRPARL